MSSVAYNLTRKMEWMGRRLRRIDDASEIKEWVTAMTAINCLLKEVHIKPCSDNWRPWSKIEYGGKKDLRDTDTVVGENSGPEPNNLSGCGGIKWKLCPKEKPKQLKKKIMRIRKPIARKGLPPRVQLAENETEVDLQKKSDIGGCTGEKTVSTAMPIDSGPMLRSGSVDIKWTAYWDPLEGCGNKGRLWWGSSTGLRQLNRPEVPREQLIITDPVLRRKSVRAVSITMKYFFNITFTFILLN